MELLSALLRVQVPAAAIAHPSLVIAADHVCAAAAAVVVQEEVTKYIQEYLYEIHVK